jgi:hypothetical protein
VVAAVSPAPEEAQALIVTLPHVSLFVPALNVEPNTQLAHVASAVRSHDAVKCCPAGQVVFLAAQTLALMTNTAEVPPLFVAVML